MKKVLLFFAMLYCAFSVFGNELSYIKNGDYAYYTDLRYDDVYLRGYMVAHVDNDVSYVFAGVKNAKTGKKWDFLFSVKDGKKPGEIDLYKDAAMPKNMTEEERPVVTQSIPDFLNFHSMYLKSKSKINYDATLEDSWGEMGFSLYYHYNKTVPFFRFTHIKFQSADGKSERDGKTLLLLSKVGKCDLSDAENIKEFLNITYDPYVNPESNIPAEMKDYKIPDAEPVTVKMNGINVTVDENWTRNELAGQPSVWIEKNTIRDAQLTIEKFPSKLSSQIQDDVVTGLFLTASVDNLILYNKVETKRVKNCLIVSYPVIDDHNCLNYCIFYLYPNYCVNFSCFYEVWKNNKDYFEGILGKIKIK